MAEVEREWVTAPVAAAMLGVSRSTVKRMIDAGRLEATRTVEPVGLLLVRVASIRALGGASDVSSDASDDTPTAAVVP